MHSVTPTDIRPMPDQPQPQEQFSDHEKDHLNYLGSMLHVDPTDKEEEQQRIFDAFDKAREQQRKFYS